MAYFDVIETTGKAYITAWEERKYFFRLALAPFFVKALFFAVVIVLGYQENILRQTLIMLPGFFMEGWMVAHVARYAFFRERWPVTLSGNTEQDILYLARRGRAIFAAIILYVLIKMAQNAFFFPIIENEQEFQSVSEGGEPSFFVFFVATIFFIGLIWGFKFLFLYIPVAVDVSIKKYLSHLPGVASSIFLIGAWLTCYVPFLILEIFVLKLLGPIFEEQNENILWYFVFNVRSSINILGAIVVTLCFTKALNFMSQNAKFKK